MNDEKKVIIGDLHFACFLENGQWTISFSEEELKDTLNEVVVEARKERTQEIIKKINDTVNVRKIQSGTPSLHNQLCLDIVRMIRKEFLSGDKE